MITYKGYVGAFEYDSEDESFHGEVVNTRDVIHFQGDSVEELKQALQDSVEDYLQFCKERGEDPDKPYSGNLLIRGSPELHRDIAAAAAKAHTSMNDWASSTLERAARRALGGDD